MVQLDIKSLFEDVKREQNFSTNISDTVIDAIEKADLNVSQKKEGINKDVENKDVENKEIDNIKVETHAKKMVKTADENRSDSSLNDSSESVLVEAKQVSQPKVVVFDYESFVLDVDFVFPNEVASETMIAHFAKRFEPIMVSLSIEILNEFRKGVPSVYYEKLQKALQEYLTGTSITMQGVTYHISNQNRVFSKQETFQKFLFFLFLSDVFKMFKQRFVMLFL